ADPAFRRRYEAARRLQAEHWAEEILEIVDAGAEDCDAEGKPLAEKDLLARAKLRVDARKWLLARLGALGEPVADPAEEAEDPERLFARDDLDAEERELLRRLLERRLAQAEEWRGAAIYLFDVDRIRSRLPDTPAPLLRKEKVLPLPLAQALQRALADPARGLRELERLECEAGLLGFTRHAWQLLEPGRRFVPGWHLEVLCDHLEAVTRGEITRLLINVPPGAMKSLTVAVLWPAWEWGPAGRPELRTIAASYSERLSLRDNMKCRRLVASEWYRGHWGRSVRLVGDQNAKGKFENERTGFRLA